MSTNQSLDATLKALADPTRRAIVSRLVRSGGGLSVGDLAEPFLKRQHMKLVGLPGRVFSGKKVPKKGAKAVFFCYALPRRDMTALSDDGEPLWTEEAGEAKWYLYEMGTEAVHEEPNEIVLFKYTKRLRMGIIQAITQPDLQPLHNSGFLLHHLFQEFFQRPYGNNVIKQHLATCFYLLLH